MPINLVAIDLDGTLLTSDKQITPRAVAAIRRAAVLGVRVVIASARPPRSVQPLYDLCGLNTVQINYNGALVWDPIGRKIILHRPMVPETVHAVIELARSRHPQTLASIEILDKWYTDKFDPTYVTETAKVFQPDKVVPFDQSLTEPVTKLMLLGPAESIIELEGLLASHFSGQLLVLRIEDYMLQIMHPTAGKSSALAAVAELYNVPRSQVMAIGDAPNDLGMIQWAGLGVAVNNAHPLVRKAADYITASNDEEGAAEAMEMFVCGKGPKPVRPPKPRTPKKAP
jgi:Cof subfamily protein (haloacid dehalogenase superfamily)